MVSKQVANQSSIVNRQSSVALKLSIVVVSWNTRQLLHDCLAAVYAYPPDCAFEVWVVDNCSHDGSAAMVREDFPQALLLESEDNLGFAGGNNRAITRSGGEYVLLLNPDTEVKPGALTALAAFLDGHPEAGGAGSMLLNGDGSLQHPSCHPLPTLSRELWRLFHLDALAAYGVYRMDRWDTAVPHPVDIIQGASFMLRRSVLDAVGLLDDSYFMYSEEVDLCFRIRRAGWLLYWVPQSQVVHYGGQSTQQVADKMFIELYRGKVHYFRKNYGVRSAAVYKAVLALAALPRVLAGLVGRLIPGPVGAAGKRVGGNYGRLLRELPDL
ncbi:MAG: glycosyltransferase family 2 protein [Ardenticatenaceae bacterium]|nr:glycosyltransferase family 2 protein [Ardenticatenaceae bacterium]MCB8990104.1 glycosyltransferase family 2 protein [Ardenticatenaceae bacterium]